MPGGSRARSTRRSVAILTPKPGARLEVVCWAAAAAAKAPSIVLAALTTSAATIAVASPEIAEGGVVTAAVTAAAAATASVVAAAAVAPVALVELRTALAGALAATLARLLQRNRLQQRTKAKSAPCAKLPTLNSCKCELQMPSQAPPGAPVIAATCVARTKVP